MPLLLSLGRETQTIDLGAHEELVFTIDELKPANGRVIARHRHNRWLHDTNSEPYARVDVIGPLNIRAVGKQTRLYGPYAHFSTVDGVAYVDRRVFAFADLQQRDWYVHDAADHWRGLQLLVHTTGP